MVVNIIKPTSLMSAPILYNESKVERETATILSAANMDGPGEDDMRRTFERYEHRSLRARNISFHMAINPLEGQDNMSDEDIVRFADKMMQGLGYGSQPYVVYKHEDIERTHYHVVSIRVRSDGRKINDFQERWRCYHLARELESEFDYKVGNKTGKERKSRVERFDPRQGNVSGQMKKLFQDCLQYRFTAYSQFELVLRGHGLLLEERTGLSTRLLLQGLDEKGRPCTKKLSQSAIGMDLYRLYSERALENLGAEKDLSSERNRIRMIAAETLQESGSEAHFRQLLSRKGISIRIDRDPGTHQITGADIVDHVTKSAFRLSELGPDFSLEILRDADACQWEHDTRDSGIGVTLGDVLAGLGGGNSKSREKDIREDPKKKRKKYPQL